MKLASTHWMRQEPLERTVRRLAEAGYDAIVIDGNPGRLEAADVPSLLARYEIECHGVLALVQHPYDLIDPHPDVRRATVEYLCQLVGVAAHLGAPLLSLAPYQEGRLTARSTPEHEWRWSVDGLKRVTERAAEHGVTVGIEPVNRYETNTLNRHDQALALVREVGPGSAVILDAFHMNLEEPDIVEAILATGPNLCEFHVADSNRLTPGRGHLDWPRILAALERIGFDGYLTLETQAPDDRTPLAWKRRHDSSLGLAAGPDESRYLRQADGFPLSDADYTSSLAEAATFLRSCIAGAQGKPSNGRRSANHRAASPRVRG